MKCMKAQIQRIVNEILDKKKKKTHTWTYNIRSQVTLQIHRSKHSFVPAQQQTHKSM